MKLSFNESLLILEQTVFLKLASRPFKSKGSYFRVSVCNNIE